MSVRHSVNRIAASFDDDILLREALDDAALHISRRVLAGIAIGRPVDDAYHALFDLHAAAEMAALDERADVFIEERTGTVLLDHILAQPSDHYLRALWYAVADAGYREAADHLAWLLELLRGRGAAAKIARAAGRPPVQLRSSTVDYQDGPERYDRACRSHYRLLPTRGSFAARIDIT